MSKRKLIPIVLTVFFMISVYFISLYSPPLYSQNLVITDSSLPVPVNLSGSTEFTILLGSNPNLGLINLNLNHFAHFSPSGSDLATFVVSALNFSHVYNVLSRLNGSLISGFFYVNSTQPVSPEISYQNVSPYQAAPFPFSPQDIASAYDFNGAYAHGDFGKGVTIAIVDAYGDPNLQYDLYSFDHISGLPAANLTINYPEGEPPSVSSQWAIETASDVEWAHAMAPEANISLFISPSSNLVSMMNITSLIVDKKLANIISFSWGIPEAGITGGEIRTFSSVLNQATSEGISVVAASGDLGAFDGEPLPSVNFPASEPSVLSVGGTSLVYFDNVMYQYAWGGNISGTSYGSGGGYSTYFSAPPYQKGIKNITDRRGVPDVAMDANNETGVYSIVGGGEYRIGGTSIGAPIWSAVIAIIDSRYGVDLGNPDYLIYKISKTSLYNSSFSQITSGSNGFYQASSGWNPVTGLGTPIVWNLTVAAGDILQPYGTSILMYANNSNFSGIEANLTIQNIEANLSYASGRDFLYLSLYSNQNQYVEAGLEFVSGEYRTLQIVKNFGIVNRTYGIWNALNGNSGPFSISLSYVNGTIRFNSTGGNLITYAFLNFTGSAYPSIGDMIRGSEDNYSVGFNGTFSNVTESTYNGNRNLTPLTLDALSLQAKGYDSIGINETGKHYKFGPGLNMSLPNHTDAGPQIDYADTFSFPSTVSLYMSNSSSSVVWKVNGVSLPGGTGSFSSSGGTYNVTAYSEASGKAIAYREIVIPELTYENLSVNSSISYDARPQFTSLVDLAAANEGSGRQKITVMNGTNQYSISSQGFNTTHILGINSRTLNITLGAEPVTFSIFVFDSRSTVTVGKTRLTENNDTFSGAGYPEEPIYLNVSSPGYLNFSTIISPMPGSHYQQQVSLSGYGLNSTYVSGEIMDSEFNFHVSYSNIYLNGTLVGYSNQTGYFEFYSSPGIKNLSVSNPLYLQYSELLHISNSTGRLKIFLSPRDVSIDTRVILSITRSFPFLFYFAYLSWNTYKGSNFSHYEIFEATSSSFYNSTVTNVFSRGDGYTFLGGVTPFHKTYVAIELYLNNSQEYTTGYISISYYNPVYVLANLAIVIGILVYIYLMIDLLYLRKRRREWGTR